MAEGAHAGPLFGAPLLPAGPFRCILADPPWQMKMRSEKGMGKSPDGLVDGGVRHYSTMAIDDLFCLDPAGAAADDCIMFMWAIDPMLPVAIDLGSKWGFTFKTVGFYWVKSSKHTKPGATGYPIGPGYWTRANPEQCLLFTRGAPKRLSASVRRLIVAPRREHSRKPDEQYAAIKALCAGPRLEMFARTERPGWTAWGDQSDRFPSRSSPAAEPS